MADLSLEDYIRKTPRFRGNARGGAQTPGGGKFVRNAISVSMSNQQRSKLNRPHSLEQREQAGFVKRRLGLQQKQNTNFNVARTGKMQDARQKLTQRKVPDARQKLLAKTKFVDARVRIENKKALQKPAVQDARVKIQIAQAKKQPQDARQKIQAQRGAVKSTGREQVIVTERGRLMSTSGVVASGSNLLKVVKSNDLAMDSVANGSSQTVNYYQTQPSGLITITRPQHDQEVDAYSQPSHIPAHMMEGGAIIQITNDMYQAPAPPLPQPAYQSVQPMYQQPQQVYQPPETAYQTQPGYYQQQQQPHALSQPPAKARTKAKVPLKRKAARPVAVPRAAKATTLDWDEDADASENPSPIQGHKVMVTNLHPVVTQEDVVELFGAMGALKKARLIKVGVAEVVFVRKEDALMAVRKYHLRELDGQPMNVILISDANPEGGSQAVAKRLAPARPTVKAAPKTTPAPKPAPAARRQSPITAPTTTSPSEAEELHQPLKFAKVAAGASSVHTNTSASSGRGSLDASVLHKALFKTVAKDESPPAPVTFTVKI